jgi:hypothetical protein
MQRFLQKFDNLENTVTDKPNIFTFGKYKGLSFDEVYEKDLPYIAWVMKQPEKYYKRIQEYYKPRIEKDYA